MSKRSIQHEFAPDIVMSSRERVEEFKNAIEYIMEAAPHKPLRRLSFTFYKGDYIGFGGTSDFTAYAFEGYYEGIIKVAYGKDGKSKDAVKRLFSAYRLMLRDQNGDFQKPEFANFNFQAGADAWAEKMHESYVRQHGLIPVRPNKKLDITPPPKWEYDYGGSKPKPKAQILEFKPREPKKKDENTTENP